MPKWWLPIISAAFIAGHILVAVFALVVFCEVQRLVLKMSPSRKGGSTKSRGMGTDGRL